MPRKINSDTPPIQKKSMKEDTVILEEPKKIRVRKDVEAETEEPKKIRVRKDVKAETEEPKKIRVRKDVEAEMEEPKKIRVRKDVEAEMEEPKKIRVRKDVEAETEEPKKTLSEEVIKISKKERQVITKENILESFDELICMVDTEIQVLRDSSVKSNNIKFLRSLNKYVKALRVQCNRVMKQKNTIPRQNNNNSGFQKPVKISKELAKFTGWSEDELRSRVDVTKYICDYIASNKLQNPQDKRQILPDTKLQKLLGFNPDKADKPLYYYGIQTYLKNQNHFPKDTD